MSDILSCILIIITMLAGAFIFYITASRFFNKIYLPYKNAIYDSSFEELLFILKTIINTELEAYDNDIFLNKGSITNSNFDTFYKDITNKIIRNVSPKMIQQLTKYISNDMVYIIIARAVKKYLTEKISGTY